MTAQPLSSISPSPGPFGFEPGHAIPAPARLSARIIARRMARPRAAAVPAQPVASGLFTAADFRQFVMAYCACFTAAMILIA